MPDYGGGAASTWANLAYGGGRQTGRDAGTSISAELVQGGK